MLGLPNLAIPYYDLVFKETGVGDRGREDLFMDTKSGNQDWRVGLQGSGWWRLCLNLATLRNPR